MSRYIGPSCRMCRREGVQLLLKGERCIGAKCAISKERPIPGSKRGKQHHSKMFGYNEQMRAKQQIRRYYGINDAQFKCNFKKASKKSGITSIDFKSQLELRLDNVVYLIGFATSRIAARQIVTHGHVIVNGRRVNYPSFILKKDDTLGIKESDRSKKLIRKNVEIAINNIKLSTPEWIFFDKEKLISKIERLPNEDELRMSDKEQLVVELYSK